MDDDQLDIEAEIETLEAEMKRLEAEYNMYFAGRLPRPPWEIRKRVLRRVTVLDRVAIRNYGSRFRFTSLQTRFARFVSLWDRALRAREEGRPGPFGGMRPSAPVPAPGPEPARARKQPAGHVEKLTDPSKETDKLRELYKNLSDARRAAGQEAIPYDKFADLVRSQVRTLREKGSPEVAFRVAVKDSKVVFTVRPVKSDRGASPKPKGKSK